MFRRSHEAARPSDLALTLLGAALCVAGSGVFYVMPSYIGSAASLHRLTDFQAGTLSSGESLAITLSCALASLLVRRIGRGLLAASAVFCVLGDLASNFAPDFHGLLAIRIATGLLGEGALYACSYSVLGRARKPDRAFALALAAAVGVGAASIAAQTVLQRFGAGGVLLPLAAAAVILVPSLAWLPTLGDPVSPQQAQAAGVSSGARSRWVLASIAVWFAAPGFYWAFADLIGTSRAISEAQVSQALAIATVVGFAGLAVPLVVGDRFGRLAPIVASTVGVIVAAWGSIIVRRYVPLATAFSLFYICWNVVSVYQLAALSASDRTGHYSGFGAVAQLIGLSSGPAVGGLLLGAFGFAAVPGCVAGFSVAGGICLLAARLPRNPDDGQSARPRADSHGIGEAIAPDRNSYVRNRPQSGL